MPNSLEDIMPKILSSALSSLRGTTIAPRLVNADFSSEAAPKGSIIHIPVPTSIQAVDVVPANVAPDPPDLRVSTRPIPLNNWKEASFYLTDRDQQNIMDGVPSMQVTEAGKSIANAIDLSILNLYKEAYWWTGTPGTTPFNDTDGTIAAIEARKILNKALAPPMDRRMVLDVEADANATGLPTFAHVDRSGETGTLYEGQIGRKLGFDFFYDQLMPNHILDRPGGAPTGYLVNQADHAVGATTVTVDTGTGDILEGDLFTVAGSDQQFTVESLAGSTLTYSPAAVDVFVDNAAITILANHAVNLAFHRDAIGMAVRSLQESELELSLGGRSMVMVDPVTQIPLRLEVVREYKRVRWSVDALWGVAAVRPEHIVRVIG